MIQENEDFRLFSAQPHNYFIKYHPFFSLCNSELSNDNEEFCWCIHDNEIAQKFYQRTEFLRKKIVFKQGPLVLKILNFCKIRGRLKIMWSYSIWKNKTDKFLGFQAQYYGILANTMMLPVVKCPSQQNHVFDAEMQ